MQLQSLLARRLRTFHLHTRRERQLLVQLRLKIQQQLLMERQRFRPGAFAAARAW